MGPLKVTSLAGLETILRLAAALVLAKVVAASEGPAGVARFGQFYSLWSVVLIAGTGSLATGLVQITARSNTAGNLEKIAGLRSCIQFVLLAGILPALLLAVCSVPISKLVLGSEDLWPLVLWVGILVIPTLLFFTLVAIRNGQSEYVHSLAARISATILSLAAAFFGLSIWSVDGALGGFATGATLALLVWAVHSGRLRSELASSFRGKGQSAAFRSLAGFAFMGLVSALALPTALMAVRAILALESGWESVGYWEAAFRLGELVSSFGTAAVAVYFIPKLMVADAATTRTLTRQMLLLVCAVISAAIAVCAIQGEQLLTMFYSAEFRVASTVLLWQVVGSSLKLVGWCFAIQMQVRGATALYVCSEIIFALLFVGLAWVAIDLGPTGISLAYGFSYLLYLVAFSWKYRQVLHRSRAEEFQT